MSSHLVEEDVPDCRTVYETRCMEDPEKEGGEEVTMATTEAIMINLT